MQAPPLFGRAFSGIMKICMPLIGLIIKIKYFPYVVFIYYNRNRVYLQNCFAAFISGVKNVQGVY